MANPATETAAQRFTRDYDTAYALDHDREDRALNHQKQERVTHIYVNKADGTTPATTHNVNP